MCDVWCVMCHVSCVMCDVSCVMCHVSCVRCHVSCVMCHVSYVPHSHDSTSSLRICHVSTWLKWLTVGHVSSEGCSTVSHLSHVSTSLKQMRMTQRWLKWLTVKHPSESVMFQHGSNDSQSVMSQSESCLNISETTENNPTTRASPPDTRGAMGWLPLVGSLKLHVSFAIEPYKRDYILQKRPVMRRSLLIVATP